MIIDSHHHFWNYNPAEYNWIDDNMKVLRKDFLPPDLKSEINKAGIDGVISVQARQNIEETNWLLNLAAENQFIFGIIGWLPIASENFHNKLEKYIETSKLVALRHVIQDEADNNFILDKAFNRGISLLENYKLSYDILIFERHLPQTIRFVDQHPNQVFILDHIAKPLISEGVLSPWDGYIKELSKRENVFCKISGMVTEADYRNWTEDQLQPYLNIVLEAFGPGRLMFGSDWPVCLLGVKYNHWVNIICKFIAELSIDEQAAIMGKNACKAYNLIC
jgi:L-fuconolactonase